MSEDVVNIAEALERVQEDNELLIELFDIFQEDFQEKRRSIDSVLESKDFDELKNIAHSIKGASSNISAKKIFVSLARLEEIAKEGDLAEIKELLVAIDEQFKELSVYISNYKAKSAE